MHYFPDLLALFKCLCTFFFVRTCPGKNQILLSLSIQISLSNVQYIQSNEWTHRHTQTHTTHSRNEKEVRRRKKSHSEGSCKFMEVEVIFSPIRVIFQTSPERTSCLLLLPFSQRSCRVLVFFVSYLCDWKRRKARKPRSSLLSFQSFA